jgi:alpha/beta superfamily hydrolase
MVSVEDAAKEPRAAMTPSTRERERGRGERAQLAATVRWLRELRPRAELRPLARQDVPAGLPGSTMERRHA